jgi:hypothetical protein
MRFMVMIKANDKSEAGIMPSDQLITEMGAYNDELTKAGIMLSAEGLLASSKGARISYSNGEISVTDGPFAEAKELIAGYWIWKVASKEEAIEWVKRCPNPDNDDFEIEIRQIGEWEDFDA